ncbi:hypothetical protein Tco_1483499 [Tanacetum coccineum]
MSFMSGSSFGFYPFQFSCPPRKLTMEEMLYKFIDEGRQEHEEMGAFIREFKTTNELLLKERNNSLSELKFELDDIHIGVVILEHSANLDKFGDVLVRISPRTAIKLSVFDHLKVMTFHGKVVSKVNPHNTLQRTGRQELSAGQLASAFGRIEMSQSARLSAGRLAASDKKKLKTRMGHQGIIKVLEWFMAIEREWRWLLRVEERIDEAMMKNTTKEV